MNGKPPQFPDEMIGQHVCSVMCENYAVSHLIVYRHREYLRSSFTRLFADRVIDPRIYKWPLGVLRPDAKSPIALSTNANSTAGTSSALGQLKLQAKNKVEDILKSKLPFKCSKCQDSAVGF